MDDCWCDYEPAEWVSKKMHVARKEHRCEECGRPIHPGERYEYTCGKWEGDVSVFKVCPRCLAIRAYVTDHVPCFCWAYGNMRDDAKNTIEEYAPELPGLWFGWARREVAATRIRP